MDKNGVEGLGEEWNSHFVGDGGVNRVLAEIPSFLLFGLGDGHIVDNVLLTSAFDSVIAKFERVYVSIEQLDSVCSLVHQVYFRQHSNRSLALRVDLSGQFQRV